MSQTTKFDCGVFQKAWQQLGLSTKIVWSVLMVLMIIAMAGITVSVLQCLVDRAAWMVSVGTREVVFATHVKQAELALMVFAGGLLWVVASLVTTVFWGLVIVHGVKSPSKEAARVRQV